MAKLTKAQLALLQDITRSEIRVVEDYKPAIKLVDLGYAAWRGELGGYLRITPAGRAALAEGDGNE